MSGETQGVRSANQRSGRGIWCVGLIAGLMLAGCSSVSLNRAPVEDRGMTPAKPVVNAPEPAPVAAPVVKPPPGAENAGKPGYYTVKPRDTLIGIGLETGQS